MEQKGILINLTVSEDELEAYMDIIPGAGGPEKVDLAYLQGMLEANGIQFGVDQAALESLAECAINHQRQDHKLIARGKKPIKGSPSYIRLKSRLFPGKEQRNLSDQLVDFKEFSPFIMVKKDEPLGKKMVETKGIPGCNIYGGEIPPGMKQIVQLEPGENTRIKEDVIYSNLPGCFQCEGKHFYVSNTLEIAGDVDYSTGHISFAGDVIINGEIKDGFRVASGGSVFCKKTLDASEILARKNLIIEGGIKGRNTGFVRVQGKIETKFIENCNVEAESGIYVKSSILDSQVYSLDRVILGKKVGAIVGGTLYAQHGVNAVNIGSQRNSHTRIYCGISFLIQRKLKHLETRLTVLSNKLQKLKALPETTEHELLKIKAEKALKMLQESIGKYLLDQYTDYNSEIQVTGTIYPGTHITICDREMTITSELSQVCIYYDKSNARLATKNIK